MARYRDIAPGEMTAAQRRVHDLIVAGRRGRFGGPFQLLIRAPEICEHAAKLGEHLRWGTSLPSFTQKDEALVHRICTELFNTQRLSDASFAEAVASLGETGLIEVIGIIGYYTLIGNTLNVFQVALPEAVTPPFPE